MWKLNGGGELTGKYIQKNTKIMVKSMVKIHF